MTDRPLPHRFELRLEVTAEPLLPALERFFREVCELAEAHPGIEPWFIIERTVPVPEVLLRVPPFPVRDEEAPAS